MAFPFQQTEELRRRIEGRLGGLRTNRYSWWGHWHELAIFILPRRYKWLITPNQAQRGSAINQHIINNTGTIAARTLAGGLLSGLSNPMSPWFKFRIEGFDDESSDVVRWLAECTRRMLTVFQESNFYNSIATLYYDIVVFGTATMLIYEDYENVICCYNPALGEFYVDVSPRLEGSVFYREFVLTIAQLVEEFGLENVDEKIRLAHNQGGVNLTRELVVVHAIEANTPINGNYPIAKSFPWRETYFVWGSPRDELLRAKGYHDFPAIIARWDTVANDPYGRSPAMDALGDIKQLQQEEKRKAQAIDKMVNPPMVADVSMKNQPASGLPGGVTYVPGFGRERPGFAPAYQVQPNLAEMRLDISGIEERIRNTFFNRLFEAITSLSDKVRSATEVKIRSEERLLMIPTIKRLDKETLARTIERTWGIMMRGGLLPKPIPAEVVGQLITVKYTGPLALAMLASETTAIEQSLAFVGQLAGAKPNALDNIDEDMTIKLYVDATGADPRILNDDRKRDAMRQQRIQEQQQQEAMQQGMAAVQGAKDLGDTNVGGGRNALQMMMGQEAA